MYSGLCAGKWSRAVGVGPTMRPRRPFVSTFSQGESLLVGVGQAAAVRIACADSFGSPRLFTLPPERSSVSSCTIVCHKPQSIPSVGRVDGTSRDNGRPAGVTDAFQVNTHSVEPRFANRCRNLLSHDDRRAGCCDEAEEVRPEVTDVLLPRAFAGNTERLTGTGSGPEGTIVGPSRKTGSE